MQGLSACGPQPLATEGSWVKYHCNILCAMLSCFFQCESRLVLPRRWVAASPWKCHVADEGCVPVFHVRFQHDFASSALMGHEAMEQAMSGAEKGFCDQASLGRLGVDASLAVARARERSQSRMGRKRTRSQAPGVSDMDIDAPEGTQPPEKRVHSAKSRWGPLRKDIVSTVGAELSSLPIAYGPSRILQASFCACGMHG